MTTSNETLKDRLGRYRELKITVVGRKSGKKISVPVWFVLEGEKVYLLPVRGAETQWFRNVVKNPTIGIDARGVGGKFRAERVRAAEAVKAVVEKFRKKYGVRDSMWRWWCCWGDRRASGEVSLRLDVWFLLWWRRERSISRKGGDQCGTEQVRIRRWTRKKSILRNLPPIFYSGLAAWAVRCYWRFSHIMSGESSEIFWWGSDCWECALRTAAEFK